MSNIVRCNLCNAEFDKDDPLYKIRTDKHTNPWHEKAWIQKRNTTQGTPKYIKVQ